jgi:hypothetical protein
VFAVECHRFNLLLCRAFRLGRDKAIRRPQRLVSDSLSAAGRKSRLGLKES